MKKIHCVLLIIMAMGYTNKLFSQSHLQIGAVGSLSKTNGFGGEVIYNFQLGKNISLGPGVKAIKFTDINTLYWPLMANLKYYVPIKKAKLFANIEPGYSIFSHDWGYLGEYTKGGFYAGGGVGIMGVSKPAPYITAQFTKYGYNDHGTSGSKRYRSINTFTITAGVSLGGR